MATAPVSPSQAMGEYLAARAAVTESEAEAEAFIGSAVTMSLTARDRRQLEALLPQLLKGATVLTRILRRNPATAQGVRLVPGIVDSSMRTLARLRRHRTPDRARGRRRRARWQYPPGAGRPAVAVLGHPSSRTRPCTGPPAPPPSASPWLRPRPPPDVPPDLSPGPRDCASASGAHPRRRHPQPRRSPTPGFRPRRHAGTSAGPRRRPSRTVRVVSDVRVPRGAVPAGRPASVAGRRRR